MDRLSLLPDDLLLEIISRIKIMDKETEEERFMSTKEVIQTTSTISKRWQHLWTRLPTLVFLDDDVRGNRDDGLTNYFSFISQTLSKCPTGDVNLDKFKLQFKSVHQPMEVQLNSWIHYAITLNVQEIDLRIIDQTKHMPCEDELFFNNSCLKSLKVSCCVFNPPNGAIRWDKLKFLRIDDSELDEEYDLLISKILCGSPCLETLEFNHCYFYGFIPKSLFGNFGVLERLSCDLETYKMFRNDDEFLFDNSYHVGMKLSRCVFDPPNGAIHWEELKFLCIVRGELDEDSIGDILSGSPFLETLQLNDCCGCRRIDVTSKSVKNLVISDYSYQDPKEDYYIDTLVINAPYISTLTIEGNMYMEKILLEKVSSLFQADLNFRVSYGFAEELEQEKSDIEQEML